MGGLRRRLRREARSAAKQLVRQGVPARSIGRIVEDERVQRVLLRMVEEVEKKLDGKEANVSVREGLAAIKEIRALKAEQQEALESAAAQTDAEMLAEEIAENKEEARLATVTAAGGGAGATRMSDAVSAKAEGSRAGVSTFAPSESEQRAAS